MLELPPLDRAAGKLAAFGISDDSRIVVYFGRTAALQSATRIIFTLDYLGPRRSHVASQRRPRRLEASRSGHDRHAVAAGRRGPSARASDRMSSRMRLREVARRTGRTTAGGRRARRCSTTAPRHHEQREGHIPGAINIPFSEITDNRQLICSANSAALFQAAGIKRATRSWPTAMSASRRPPSSCRAAARTSP